jgi:hypothetical protein
MNGDPTGSSISGESTAGLRRRPAEQRPIFGETNSGELLDPEPRDPNLRGSLVDRSWGENRGSEDLLGAIFSSFSGGFFVKIPKGKIPVI